MTEIYQPFVTTGANRPGNIVVLCDHARNHVPDAVNKGCLGLPSDEMDRHIAYDIGAEGVSLNLGELLNAPVVCSNFSRIVIDPNRGEDDPTLVRRLYDGAIIPGNRYADEIERQRRLNLCHRPYHLELNRVISERENPILVSIHSFTPQLKGRNRRPWEIGILSARDRRLSDALLSELETNTPYCIGDNQPYNGALEGDTMERHALSNQHHHTLIELRNDLIETPKGQRDWAEQLAPLIQSAVKQVN